MTGFYRHVLACNIWDPGQFAPFLVGGRRVGWVRRDTIPLLVGFPETFHISARAVELSDHLETPDARTEAIDRVGRALVAQGHAPPYRQEDFDAAPAWGEAPCFRLDRGLVPFFGIKGYGVHLNGYFTDAHGLGLWIGHRSASKKVDPLKLDNVVAGGIAAGHGVLRTLEKEGAEEASMTPALLAAAVPVGEIRYRCAVPEGMREDVLFLYDLEVPDSFTPCNTDGEFDSFARMSLAACLDLVANTDRFKFNVNLTVIDFAIRHGAITPDHPEYASLASGLRGGLILEP